MSDTLWAVIVGGLLTGGAAVGAQVLAARIQAAAARDAWNRDQAAAQLAVLENTYLGILRSAHQVENAVASWQSGTLLSTQAHGFIGAGNRDLETAGLAIILIGGLDDPIVGLITRLRDEAEAYADLNLVSRATPATDEEKATQAAAASAAADELADHLHKGFLKANIKAAYK
jgi:hypothetical protein